MSMVELCQCRGCKRCTPITWCHPPIGTMWRITEGIAEGIVDLSLECRDRNNLTLISRGFLVGFKFKDSKVVDQLKYLDFDLCWIFDPTLLTYDVRR